MLLSRAASAVAAHRRLLDKLGARSLVVAKRRPACGEAWLVESRITSIKSAGERCEQVVLDASCAAGTLIFVVDLDGATFDVASWDTLQVGTRRHVRFGAKVASPKNPAAVALRCPSSLVTADTSRRCLGSKIEPQLDRTQHKVRNRQRGSQSAGT